MEITVVRSNRKTLSLQVTAQGQVLVRCPRRVSRAYALRFAEEHRDWIQKKLSNLPPALEPFTEEELKILTARAKQEFPGKTASFATLMGVSYGKITIRSQKTRWGSCSAKGNLNFNCLLMLAPERVRDYVIVHELAHRKQMNHSAAFWQEVEAILPDYRERRNWLKVNGNALIGRLPQ